MRPQPDPPRLRHWKCRQVYHVYQRGSQRQQTFLRPADCLLYLDRLDQLARRYKVRLHAFSLMSNHVHFLLEPLRKGAISRLMQHLQSGHARYMNGLKHTQGHLWHHHFHAKLIKSASQYCETLLYIERNPVAANIAKQAHLYDYSSARAHVQNQPLLTLTHKKLRVTIKLYLDRWRREFEFSPNEDPHWKDWLRSTRLAAHDREIAQIRGKHIPIPQPMSPLTPQTQAAARGS